MNPPAAKIKKIFYYYSFSVTFRVPRHSFSDGWCPSACPVKFFAEDKQSGFNWGGGCFDEEQSKIRINSE